MRNPRLDNWIDTMRSPQGVRLVVQLAAMVLGMGLVWLVISAFLWLFPLWVIIPATIGLGIYVFTRESVEGRRQRWVDSGRCGGCGYDLRATPEKCPECGRDVRLDEPAWRRLRRTYAEAAAAGKPIAPARPVEPVPVLPIPVARKKPVELSPIPLED